MGGGENVRNSYWQVGRVRERESSKQPGWEVLELIHTQNTQRERLKISSQKYVKMWVGGDCRWTGGGGKMGGNMEEEGGKQ